MSHFDLKITFQRTILQISDSLFSTKNNSYKMWTRDFSLLQETNNVKHDWREGLRVYEFDSSLRVVRHNVFSLSGQNQEMTILGIEDFGRFFDSKFIILNNAVMWGGCKLSCHTHYNSTIILLIKCNFKKQAK